MKLKNDGDIAALEMAAAQEIAGPLVKNFGASEDIKKIHAMMEEKSKAFASELHSELIKAVRKSFGGCLKDGRNCTTLTLTYHLLIQHFAPTLQEGKEIAITAIGAAFAPAGHALVAANLIRVYYVLLPSLPLATLVTPI